MAANLQKDRWKLSLFEIWKQTLWAGEEERKDREREEGKDNGREILIFYVTILKF